MKLSINSKEFIDISEDCFQKVLNGFIQKYSTLHSLCITYETKDDYQIRKFRELQNPIDANSEEFKTLIKKIGKK